MNKKERKELIEIRIAEVKDFADLCSLFNESHAMHHKALPHFFINPSDIVYKKAFFDPAFKQKDEIILIAVRNGKIIGAIYPKVYKMEPKHRPQVLKTRRFGFIETLVVHKSARKHGIGHQLLAAAEKWLREKGLKEVDLLVWNFNHEAEELYRKMGYQPLNTKMYKTL